MSGSCLIWSHLTVRGCRLSVVAVVEVRFHFSCPKMSDRLLYQTEAEQLMLERGLVVAEPEVPFFRFSGGLWNGIQGNEQATVGLSLSIYRCKAPPEQNMNT